MENREESVIRPTLKRMVEQSSLNRKEITKEEIMEHQERKKNMVYKNMNKTNRLPSPFEFPKLCLMVEAKLIMLYTFSKCIQRKYLRQLNYKWGG